MSSAIQRWMRIVTLLAGVLAAPGNAAASGYQAAGGRIYDASGQEVTLRGINHFGFNAVILQPQFLWAMGWKEQIAQIKSLGFNAIRVPFVPDTLYSSTAVNELSYVDPGRNPELIGKTPLQVLDLWLAEADRQGLYLLLDFHSVSKVRQYPTWFLANPADFALIYNGQAYTKDNWTRDLAFVARRYAHLSHFLGIDLYNEPNGIVRWSVGDPGASNPDHHWKAAAELAAAAVLTANPNLLIFVQGINGNYDGVENSNIPMNWGEDFQPQAYQPLNIPGGKLVLSPHTYGPDVYMKSSFNAASFPANLAASWDTLFGQFAQAYPVVPGEWGGRYGQGAGGQKDATWQNAFVDYLLSRGIRNNFYWCYTPNSGDTGGILDDDLTVRQDKMQLLRRLWETPAATPPANPPPPAPAPGDRQQSIANFSPGSGAVGTVVTLNGSGFTGSTHAWIGAARNGTVRVLSDTQLTVTIPADATSGAIGIFNPAHSAFTATSFSVSGSAAPIPPSPSPPPQPPPGVAQQSITNFSPGSGAVGTVVTVNGSGFTGSTHAWVGAARNGAVRVLSDAQLQVTIPADATSGAIGIFNSSHSAFTATSFTVTSGAAPYPQQSIASFSPSAGPIGTVVTVNGSGFTGSTLAWIGAARNGGVQVISDSQLQVTIPAGATSGAIGIFNPAHAAFTAGPFTVR